MVARFVFAVRGDSRAGAAGTGRRGMSSGEYMPFATVSDESLIDVYNFVSCLQLGGTTP